MGSGHGSMVLRGYWTGNAKLTSCVYERVSGAWHVVDGTLTRKGCITLALPRSLSVRFARVSRAQSSVGEEQMLPSPVLVPPDASECTRIDGHPYRHRRYRRPQFDASDELDSQHARM